MLEDKQICFLGAGSMAEAIISGMLSHKIVQPSQIMVTNKRNRTRLQELVNRLKVSAPHPDQRMDAIQEADILVLAMKPKDVQEALKEIREWTHSSQLVLSVLAGVSTDDITHLLQTEAPVIRTMPNTSAVVGYSATGMSAGRYVRAEHMDLAQHIFESIGIVFVTEEEKLDAVTGLAGSGPAYVYYLVESMIKGGMDAGLEPEEAKMLAMQAFLGAAQMLRETGADPANLRAQITSPNGTTQKGIETLQAHQFEEAIRKCITNAAERSKELGKWLSDQLNV